MGGTDASWGPGQAPRNPALLNLCLSAELWSCLTCFCQLLSDKFFWFPQLGVHGIYQAVPVWCPCLVPTSSCSRARRCLHVCGGKPLDGLALYPRLIAFQAGCPTPAPGAARAQLQFLGGVHTSSLGLGSPAVYPKPASPILQGLGYCPTVSHAAASEWGLAVVTGWNWGLV